MILNQYSKGSISNLRNPKHRIKYEIIDDELTLRIQSMLVLELYREEIIHQNQRKEIVLSIGGIKIGNYFITDFLYPNNHSDSTTMYLKKVREINN
jgi:hypothetical protein